MMSQTILSSIIILANLLWCCIYCKNSHHAPMQLVRFIQASEVDFSHS